MALGRVRNQSEIFCQFIFRRKLANSLYPGTNPFGYNYGKNNHTKYSLSNTYKFQHVFNAMKNARICHWRSKKIAAFLHQELFIQEKAYLTRPLSPHEAVHAASFLSHSLHFQSVSCHPFVIHMTQSKQSTLFVQPEHLSYKILADLYLQESTIGD